MRTARLRRTALHQVAVDPWRAALALSGDERPFVLTGRWAGGGAILGSAPVRVATPGEDPFALLDEQPPVERGDAPEHAVGGGWVGRLGFGLARRVEHVPPPPPRPVALPDADLAFYDHVLRLDPEGRWWFEALWTHARDGALAERLETLRRRLGAAAAAPPAAARLGPFALRAPGATGHRAAVAACRERIAAGDLFQASLCLRLDGDWHGSPAALFARAAGALRPDRAALVTGARSAAVSLSPELFLERHGRTVRTAPIKGTAPLEDGDAGAALAASAKDRAENVMIADLMRNDLGRVCAYGSVRVDALAEPRVHAGVAHLVSEVRGTLREDATDADLLRATFPPGSVTGAPKVQALRVIDELEATGRETYTGAIGFASPVAGLELSVAIRTFELGGDRAWLGAGGGVTWGSDPEAELEECLVKARPLLAAAGTRLAADGTRPAAERPRRATAPAPPEALAHGERPDPAHGVLTTLLVHDGVPVDLEAHLARLRASAAALGLDAPAGDVLPDGLAGTLRARVVLTPGRAAHVETGPVPPPRPAVLAPVTLPGGLGEHKWADRRLLDALARRHGATPLLVDLDGDVLETGWASVLALERGALVGPPRDGRLLDSTSRRRVEGHARALGLAVREEPLTLERLRAARAILVATALRGPATATLQGGPPSGHVPDVHALQAAWRAALPGSGAPARSTSTSSSSACWSPSRA